MGKIYLKEKINKMSVNWINVLCYFWKPQKYNCIKLTFSRLLLNVFLYNVFLLGDNIGDSAFALLDLMNKSVMNKCLIYN